MTHVKHLGFEMELLVLQIAQALLWIPEQSRDVVIDHLAPKRLQDAVRQVLER